MKKMLSILLCFLLALCSVIPVFASGEETPADEDRQIFTYGDYTISYRVFEAENEKAKIMMIHGFAMSSYCFVPLAEELCSAGYTCVLSDLPGFGYSSREDSETELLPREEIIYALMMSVDERPWYVAGHSMGGYIACAIAKAHPESVINLLLYATGGNDADNEAGAKMINPVSCAVMNAMTAVISRCTLLVRILLGFAANDFRYAVSYDIGKITDPVKVSGTGASALYSFTMLPATDYGALKDGSPVLFVNGDRDYVINDKSKDSFRECLPEDSADIIIKGAGHLVIETHPALVAEYTLDFIENN